MPKNHLNFANTVVVFMMCIIFYLVIPTIIPEVMYQTQNEGDTSSFTCQATGEPVPTITWYFSGAPVDEVNTMKYMISMTPLNTTTISNTLTIMNVESSDVGTYTCNATNGVSSVTSSRVLTVNGELLLFIIIFMDYIYNSWS